MCLCARIWCCNTDGQQQQLQATNVWPVEHTKWRLCLSDYGTRSLYLSVSFSLSVFLTPSLLSLLLVFPAKILRQFNINAAVVTNSCNHFCRSSLVEQLRPLTTLKLWRKMKSIVFSVFVLLLACLLDHMVQAGGKGDTIIIGGGGGGGG